MAIDLADLVPAVRAETSPPGTDLFPSASDDDWLLRLQNAFWESKMFGFAQLSNYTESDGLVQPITGIIELPREEQQLMVLFAAATSVRMAMINTGTAFRVAAGPVKFETENSATLLREIMMEINRKIDILYGLLARIGRVTDSYFDGATERDISLSFGDTKWWGAGSVPWGVSSPHRNW
jgi:hypothetical protein